MGAIHFSIDPVLAALLAKRLELTVFIETGTFKGDSVAAVRPSFEELHTCELSPELHAAATQRFANDPAVHCHLGSSPDRLRALAAIHARHPVMYWLDAHWCSAAQTAGEESQCPLLEELEAIAPLHPESIVWIDDARYFMAPPTAPLEARGWPTFQQVLDCLQSLSTQHHLVFANDTILFHPARIAGEVATYLHTQGADWLAIAHASRLTDELRATCEQLRIACEQRHERPAGRSQFRKWFRAVRRRPVPTP
ncbi:MAG: hypothetical protein WCC69_11165 [Pirellulales bacterium]